MTIGEGRRDGRTEAASPDGGLVRVRRRLPDDGIWDRADPRAGGNRERTTLRRLLEQCAASDPAAIEHLYRRYWPDLFQMCMSRLRDPDAAEDVAQETFARALAGISRLDPNRHPWPWLRTIGDRLCTNFVRRGRLAHPTPHVGIEQTASGGSDGRRDATLESVLRREQGRHLHQALLALSPRQRSLLLQQVLEGMSYADIAAAEGLSIPALKTALFRARAAARRAYEHRSGPYPQS